MCNREIWSRRIDCFFFREALRPSGADRQGVVPTPLTVRVEKCPDLARIKAGGLRRLRLRGLRFAVCAVCRLRDVRIAGFVVCGFCGLRVLRFAGFAVCGFCGFRRLRFAGLAVCGLRG